jgi:hypothetical protein
MEVKKEPKILMANSYPTEFVFEVKNENLPQLENLPHLPFSDPKGELSNLKASFKNRADKIFIWTAMKSRQTAERRNFSFHKNRVFSDKKS